MKVTFAITQTKAIWREFKRTHAKTQKGQELLCYYISGEE